MVVQMPTIQVGGNYHLKTISPELIRKLHSDLMGLIRRHLPRRKRLVGVIGNTPASLSKVLFDGIHLCCRRVRETVQPGYIGFCARFLFVDDVLEDAGKMALGGPDFCGGHESSLNLIVRIILNYQGFNIAYCVKMA